MAGLIWTQQMRVSFVNYSMQGNSGFYTTSCQLSQLLIWNSLHFLEISNVPVPAKNAYGGEERCKNLETKLKIQVTSTLPLLCAKEKSHRYPPNRKLGGLPKPAWAGE
jgi:hypothetical protein